MLLVCGLSATAQVLARPGWAGSGVTTRPWWQDAVVYRIDTERFQDSGSSGRGDLAGLVQRMDYLQSLGVDALLLDAASPADPAFENLIRSASQHHLRLVLTVTPAMRGNPQTALATVHEWLGSGIAGVYLPAEPGSAAQLPGTVEFQKQVAVLLASFPGGRALLAGNDIAVRIPPVSGRRAPSSFLAGAPGGEWRLVGGLAGDRPSPSDTRTALLATSVSSAGGAVPMLHFAPDPPTDSPGAIADAALLLTSRGGALLDFGDEIGLDTRVDLPGSTSTETVMQWTPANVQQTAAAPILRISPGESNAETVYGPYRPYVHPPPSRLTGPAPAAQPVTLDGNIPAALPDPDTLPGFTAGSLPVPTVGGERLNVAAEERDPSSVLNAYRQLIALHHGNATLREGAETVLNRDAQGAVVCIRRAPANLRTAADVIVAANLTGAPVVLSLDGDLTGLGVGRGALRSLFSFGASAMTGETTHELRLPPHGVFVGEISRRR